MSSLKSQGNQHYVILQADRYLIKRRDVEGYFQERFFFPPSLLFCADGARRRFETFLIIWLVGRVYVTSAVNTAAFVTRPPTQLIDTVLPLLLRPCRPPPLITHGYKWALSPLAIMMLVFQFIWLRHLLLWNVAKHSRGIELTSWREREGKTCWIGQVFFAAETKLHEWKSLTFDLEAQMVNSDQHIYIYIYFKFEVKPCELKQSIQWWEWNKGSVREKNKLAGFDRTLKSTFWNICYLELTAGL